MDHFEGTHNLEFHQWMLEEGHIQYKQFLQRMIDGEVWLSGQGTSNESF